MYEIQYLLGPSDVDRLLSVLLQELALVDENMQSKNIP